MNINVLRLENRRIFYFAAVIVMVLAMIVPALVSAAQLPSRSIQLSNASVSATNVTYQVNFTPQTTGAVAFVVDFCSNSPLIGQACTAPAGFTSAGAATSSAGFSIDSATANRVVVAGTMTTAPVSVNISGITNPSAAGPLYARIVTFDNLTNAAASTPENLGASAVDDGGVAISITNTIGVSGVVLESLTFCVSKAAITDNCATTTAPTVQLGETVGSTVALTPGVVSEDSIHTQISTNAAGGAVIRLKSNAVDCGGLLRAGAPTACDILPALNTDVEENASQAKFGIKTATATDTDLSANGTLQPVSGSFYNNTTFALNYIAGNATGVTSTFGDPFLDTDNAPANAKNMQLTFGATVTNDTPAGAYSAELSLIAVGKF